MDEQEHISSCPKGTDHQQGEKISALGFQQLMLRAQVVGDAHLPPQGARGRATCLHYAAGSGDVLGDTDFIAALQEDGSVVVDIQDSHVHGSSPRAPVPGGAIVCRERKVREGGSITSLHRWCTAPGC